MTLLPEIRSELLATATRRSAADARAPRGSRLSGGAVGVALGVGCAIAVVIVAVVALRDRALAPTNSAAPGNSPLAALEAKLAVLRRPQTPADRSYPRFVVTARGRRVPLGSIPQLTRLAATITTPTAGPVRVYLFVRRLSAPHAPPASRAGVLTAVAVNPHGQLAGTAEAPSSAALRPDTVDWMMTWRRLGSNPSYRVYVGIVPDGVERVKWTFTGAGFGVLHPRPVIVYAPVHNNVVVAPARAGEGPLTSAVWYGAGGRVIASAGSDAQTRRALQQIDAFNASRGLPIAPALIAHYSLFRTIPANGMGNDPALPAPDTGQALNYWQTRYIGSLTGLDGPGVWVTPGLHWLCINDPYPTAIGPSRSCWPAARARPSR